MSNVPVVAERLAIPLVFHIFVAIRETTTSCPPPPFPNSIGDIVTFVGRHHRALMRTNKQKLQAAQAAAAERQGKRRVRMRAAGRPDTAPTDAALIEALRFVMAQELVSTLERDPAAKSRQTVATMKLGLIDIRDAALEVLVGRLGYDPVHSRRAIAHRLAPKVEHRDPSYVPSLYPDSAAQRSRAS